MTVVSIFLSENTLGLSYFSYQSKQISTSSIFVQPKNLVDILSVLISISDLTTLLVPSNIPPHLFQFLKEALIDIFGEGVRIQKVLSSEFLFDQSLSKLLDLNFSSYSTNSPQNYSEKQQILSTLLDLERTSSISSIGGLLCYLQNSQLTDYSFPIEKVIFLKNYGQRVHFNLQTLNYLSIFKGEMHPSLIKGRGKTKEGYSLFMLFSKFAQTKEGLQRLKCIFLTPTKDITILKIRNQKIQYFTNQPKEKIRGICSHLQKCSSLTPILSKLEAVQMTFDDWKRFKQTLESYLYLLKNFQQGIKEADKSLFVEDMPEETLSKVCEINELLDEYLEFTAGEMSIRNGKVEELNELLKIYENLDELLEYHSQQEIERLKEGRKNVPQVMLQYFPQLGFYVALKENVHNLTGDKKDQIGEDIERSERESKNRKTKDNEEEDEKEDDIEGDEQNESVQSSGEKIRSEMTRKFGLPRDYEFCFSLSEASIFKNSLCIRLDEMYGDIQCRIVDLQRNSIRELEEKILESSEFLQSANEFVSDLDAYLSLFLAADAYQLRKPELCEESVLVLYQVRNLLTQIVVGEKSFVPNNFSVFDFESHPGAIFESLKQPSMLNSQFSNRFTFLTGPNYSGKSVFLKTVGMTCYLAHIGSFVPCRFARIGILDAIYSTSGQHDSVLKFQGESLRELSTLNFILSQSTNRSLLLIDELGKSLKLSESLVLNYSLVNCLTTQDFSEEPDFKDNKLFDESHKRNTCNVIEHQTLSQYEKIPITLMTSHLYQLFDVPQFKESYILRFAHMELLFEEGQKITHLSNLNGNISTNSKIVQLYKLTKGASFKSCAALIVRDIIGQRGASLIARIFQINQCIQDLRIEELQPLRKLQEINLQKVEDTIRMLLNN